jgi:intracellular multiplication protein IcmP
MAAQQPNQSESPYGVLWVIAAIFLGLGALWWNFKPQIVEAYFQLKLVEVNLFGHFTNNLDDLRTILTSANPSQISLNDLLVIGNVVGYYLRIPCIIIIIILAIAIYLTNSVRAYKRIYSMRMLAELEQSNWPQISPVTKLDLVKTDIDKGPWAMAMTPMQFCKRFGLLEEYKRQPQEGMTRKEMNRVEVRLKRGRSNTIFATQLGAMWTGTKSLPTHTKALFAIFAARANGDPAAFDLLKQLSMSSTTTLNFAGVDELLKKHESSKIAATVAGSHAYVLTVMASMLECARLDGVQASADFLWLKPLDRRLWYTLNTVGRQTPFVEIAGIFAHWVAEKEMGKKLLVPMVEEATNALELALKDVIYKPEEETK